MICLASASPRRAEILRAAGIPFVVRVAQIEEIRVADEPAEDYVRRLAEAKAERVLAESDKSLPPYLVAADTTVVLEGAVLEKPADAADARRMLQLLAGRTHEVYTGVCVAGPGGRILDIECTRVRFLSLDAEEIDDYIASGEPMDKAGAYAIQGRASRFIDRIEGCYFNVVGLPISLVWRHLRRLGY